MHTQYTAYNYDPLNKIEKIVQFGAFSVYFDENLFVVILYSICFYKKKDDYINININNNNNNNNNNKIFISYMLHVFVNSTL